MMEIDELAFRQADGGLPTRWAAGSAPGESGVAILGLRFRGAAHFHANIGYHLVGFTSAVRIECRRGRQAVRHNATAGSFAVIPAGMDWSADTDESVNSLLIAIDPRQFTLVTAENLALEAQLIELSIGHDPALLGLARSLVQESAASYPNGALFWNEIANAFVDNLVAGYSWEVESRTRGTLGKNVFKRLRDYVIAHLDEPIEVAALADMAGRSPFHFSRVFAKSVGLSPHRYVVHLRLQRALELVREGQSSLAEIAIRTGFADQSHLSRWVRRVHGVSLTQLA
jgi:AraC family transcriptional regulator